MKDYTEAQKHFLDRWLRGMTCRNICRQEIIWKDTSGRFILMLHNSHASYVNRMTGSVCCGVYRALYDLDKVKEDVCCLNGNTYLKKWEGRWKKSYGEEVKRIISEILDKESLSGDA